MMPTPKRLAVVLAVTGVLAIGGSVAGASAASAAGLALFDGVPGGAEACTNKSVEGQGATAGTENRVCQGSGLTFIGPSLGQAATMVGPTIVGTPLIGTSVVAAGDVATAP
jgi:hypothetical protein